jgi:hypothetical protein
VSFAGLAVSPLYTLNRIHNQLFQHGQIKVGQLLKVQAGFTHLVLTELGK